MKLWRLIKLDDNQNEIHSKELYNKLVEKVLSFGRKTINHLNDKRSKNINDTDAVLYGALRMVLEYLFTSDEKDLEFHQILNSDDKEEKLYTMKRTGVLCSILSESPYIFFHNGASSKKGRVYISSCIKINNVNYNILISANNEILKRNSWQESMRGYVEELENKSLSKIVKIIV